MRWFKHYTDAHRGQSIQRLMDEHRHVGLCYFLLIELCAEKLDKKEDEDLSEADCVFVFHRRVIESTLRLKLQGVIRLLDTCSTCGLLCYESDGNVIKISMPKLLEYLEYDQKKSRRKTAAIPPEKRLDKEEDKDKDILLAKTTEPEKPARVRKPRKAFEPTSEAELWSAISDETKAAWIKLYPDEKFRERQLTRCFAYYSQRPQKKPKTLTGWIGKLDFWFVNDWERRGKFNAAETNKNAPPAIRYPDASTLPKPPPPEEREGGPEAAAKVRELLRKSFGPKKLEGA